MLYDKDIREPLFYFLEEEYGKIRILQEKNIGNSRADALMVTEEFLYGIEIKSDADTYARLAGQVKDYDKFYDYNYIVVGTSHAAHIKEHVPDYWGIITVEELDGLKDANNSFEQDEKVDFYILRKPQKNPNVDKKNKISLLWRPEIAHIQEINGLFKYSSKSKEFVIDYISQAVPEEKLWKQVCEELFERDYNEIFNKINEYREQHGRKKRRRKRKTKYRKSK